MTSSTEAYYGLLKRAFESAPITRHVRQVMETVEHGSVTIRLPADPRLCHGAARIHGGVLGLVLDNAGFFAAATTTDGHWVATTEYKLHLLESVSAVDVIAVGKVLRRGRHLIHAEMRAMNEAGDVLAAGMGTYAVLPRRFSEPASS